jgi:hypothetical protein
LGTNVRTSQESGENSLLSRSRIDLTKRMFWIYASELCERAFNCPLRTIDLRVRLTFSHNGILIGQISKIKLVLPNTRYPEKGDRASYTLPDRKLSTSSFFFFFLPSRSLRLRGSIMPIQFGGK